MRRPDKAGGKAVKTRRPKTLKRRNAPKTAHRSGSSGKETNAQLRRQRDEALEQQAATSEVLKVISSSTGELQPVFQTMLENAVRICEAKFGVLFRVEDGAVSAAAMFGVPQKFAEFWEQGPRRPGRGTALGRAVETRQIVHIADVKLESAYVEGEPVFLAAVSLGGFRTLIVVPMLKDNELVGLIGIYRQEVRPFSDKQIDLVQNFAAQAVIAIENARLLNELRQRTDDLSESLDRQTATSEVLKVISSSPGKLDPVFQTMLANAQSGHCQRPSKVPIKVATMPSEIGGTSMKRRDFIALLGGAAASWPFAARAQRPAKPVIGFLGPASPSTFASRIEAIRQGLRDFGYVEGTNITIEYRWAEGHYERLPELATELVRSNVDLIITHGTPGSLAAKRATTTIPIVMANIGDPVATGVVASIARPGGNITGQTFSNPELRAKRVELLKEVMPRLTHVAVILNADNPAVGPEFQAMEKAAQVLDIKLQPFRLREPSELVSAFEKMEQTNVEAVETGDDPLAVANVGAIVALASRARLLSIGAEDVPRAGGIIGYGVDFVAVFRRAGFFVDKILKGTKPADLPIERVSKFQFILNRKAAKALGFELPQSILLRADEVIE